MNYFLYMMVTWMITGVAFGGVGAVMALRAGLAKQVRWLRYLLGCFIVGPIMLYVANYLVKEWKVRERAMKLRKGSRAILDMVYLLEMLDVHDGSLTASDAEDLARKHLRIK